MQYNHLKRNVCTKLKISLGTFLRCFDGLCNRERVKILGTIAKKKKTPAELKGFVLRKWCVNQYCFHSCLCLPQVVVRSRLNSCAIGPFAQSKYQPSEKGVRERVDAYNHHFFFPLMSQVLISFTCTIYFHLKAWLCNVEVTKD